MFRKTLFIVSILILMNASYSVAAEVEDFFVLANDAYRQGDYAQAIKGYTEITNEGFESSSVYFNLGNAYTKDDNLGRAILSYERALWIDPRDADINANYKYVLSQAQVNRSGSDENMLLKSIDGHIKFYSINEMFIISCLSSFCIFVVGLIGGSFLRVKSTRMLLLIGSILVSTVFVSGLILKINLFNQAAIVLNDVDGKYEPREEAVVHFQIREAERVDVVKVLNGWAKVRRKDGKLGWIEAQFVEKIIL